MVKKIYLFFLIFCFFAGIIFLSFKYYDFSNVEKIVKNEISKTSEEEEKKNIFWHFIFGLLIFYLAFYLSRYAVKGVDVILKKINDKFNENKTVTQR